MQESNIKKHQQSSAFLSTTYVVILIALIYLISGLFLTKYPTAYMDEAQLDSISLSKIGKFHISVFRESSSFYPIGFLYFGSHYICFKFLGYTLFAARITSLLCMYGASFFLYRIILRFTSNIKLGFITVVLFSIIETVIYASHLARPEVFLLFWILMCLYLFLKVAKSDLFYKHLVFGLLCGVGFEIHLNAFILCLCILLLYIFYEYQSWKKKLKRIIAWGLGAGTILLISFLVRYYMYPLFFIHLDAFANLQGNSDGLSYRLKRNIIFFVKSFWEPRYHRKMLDFAILCIAVIGSFYFLLSKKYNNSYKLPIKFFFICLFSFEAGFLIMGVFDTNYIIFLYPFFIVLFSLLLPGLSNIWIKINASTSKILTILIVIFASQSAYTFWKFYPSNYEEYLSKVKVYLPSGNTVIGDEINGYGFFEKYDYIAFRDIVFAVNHQKMSIEDYFRKYNIKYIIYTEYWDYMVKNNIGYGNIDRKIFESFLNKNAEQIGLVHDYVYGMANQKFGNCWTIIYKIKESI